MVVSRQCFQTGGSDGWQRQQGDLVGNLGRDPEVRTFPNGGKVVNLRIATSENWRDRAAASARSDRVALGGIFNENLGRVAEQYLRKGSKVYIEGQLETRKWQDQWARTATPPR